MTEIAEVGPLSEAKLCELDSLIAKPCDEGSELVEIYVGELRELLRGYRASQPDPRVSALVEAATFLLWQRDRQGPVMESLEAWEALRSSIATFKGVPTHD